MKRLHFYTILFILITINAFSQSLIVLPQPEEGASYTVSETPFAFKGKMYVQYIDAESCKHLGVFTGTGIQIFANPEECSYYKTGYYGSPVVYKDKMYIRYKSNEDNGTYVLAEFDGTQINIIENKEPLASYSGNPVIYKDKLLLNFKTTSGKSILASFDGTDITAIPNPDAGNGYLDQPFVFGENLYIRYLDNAGYRRIVRYNDTVNTILNSPASSQYEGSPIVYNNKLFLRYYHGVSYTLAQLNGSSVSFIAKPDAGWGYLGDPVVFQDELFIQYYTIARKSVLAKYNGGSLQLISNPDAGGVAGSPLVSNGRLYMRYTNASFKNVLVRYNDGVLLTIPNPDAGEGHYGSPVDINGNLFFRYMNTNLRQVIARYNGLSYTLIENQNTNDAGYFGLPFIFEGKFFISYLIGGVDQRLAYLCIAPARISLATADNKLSIPGSEWVSMNHFPGIHETYINSSGCYSFSQIINPDINLGLTKIRATVGETLLLHNAKPLVPRWYEITTEHTGATTEVILYYTQHDFNRYNEYAIVNGLPLLPEGSEDTNAFPNIRILKVSGGDLNTGTLDMLAPVISWHSDYYRWEVRFTTTGFSIFYLYADDAPLPVSLLSFTAKKVAGGIELNWVSATEENNAWFDIQRSTDGFDYISIAKVDSKTKNGTSLNTIHYDYLDAITQGSKIYYRLQQHDKDGKSKLSKVVSVQMNTMNNVKLYPNPTKGIINIGISSANKRLLVVSLYDAGGRTVKVFKQPCTAGNAVFLINAGGIPSGTYWLVIKEQQKIIYQEKVIRL